MSTPYDDIIDLPHPTSQKHPRIPMISRAAQFSPFAALTGYGGAIRETERLTDQKIELTEEETLLLDEKLRNLAGAFPDGPEAEITYFRPDSKKDGGVYVTVMGAVTKLDRLNRFVLLDNGTIIPIEDILKIENELG